MKKIMLAVLGSCLSICLSMAQTIRGNVVNNNNDPLENANIAVLNSTQRIATDENGWFELDLKSGSYQLQVSRLGYATKVIKINTEESLEIRVVLQFSNVAVDDLVITAQKKEQRLQNVSAAVTGLHSKRLEQTRTWNLSDIVSLVPNYLYTELGVGFQQLQSIRGIQAFNENPAIATYVDGVNSLDITAGGFQLIDIERIEVLRGPQGTLYGRNSLGGVVNIITKKPTNKTSGSYESSIGNLGLQRHAFGYRTPLEDDKLFFGVTGLYQYRNGFLTNSTNGTGDPIQGEDGRRVGDEGSIYGNVFLKWLPSSSWDFTFNLKGQVDYSNASAFFVSVQDDQLAIANPDQINLGRVGEHGRNILNSSIAMNYYGENYKISSITAYQRVGLRFDNINFSPAFQGQVFASYNDGRVGDFNKPQKIFSQELRISSENKNGRLNYSGGIFYFNQTNYEPSTNAARIVDDTTLDVLSQVAKNNGIAFFGEATYNFSEEFQVTAGLRYENETKQLTFSRFNDVNGNITFVDPRTEESKNYNALIPKLVVAYSLGDTEHLYASYTHGFRAGGINGNILPPGVPQTFDSEFSNNYEIGYKSQWFENKLQLNLAAFYIDWRNLQTFNSFGNSVFARTNVGDARSIGFELEAIAIPAKGLQVEMSTGLNSTDYKDFLLSRDVFDPTSGTVQTVTTDISGNTLVNAPEHTLFLAGQYEIPVSDSWNLTLRGEFRNVGRQFSDIQNDLKISSYSLINSLFSIGNDRYTFSIWGRNWTNKRYIVFGASDTSFGRNTRISAPRTYGATVNIKF